MFFLRRTQTASVPLLQERNLPACYDQFRGTKIFNIIEHPKPEGDRVFLKVPYAGAAAVKASGARWDPDARRWWYWSGEKIAHEHDPGMWLGALAAWHNKSMFSEWPIDAEYMRWIKFEKPTELFDYTPSNPTARVK